MNKYICKYCKKEITHRRGKKIPVFCGIDCKGEWQREQKPVNKEWLEQKYLVEQLGTYEIAKLVHRDPKRVYDWLLDYKIPIRSRRESIILFNKRQSTREKRSASHKGIKETDETRRKLSIAKMGKPVPLLRGARNGMYGRTGEKSNNWLGGITRERREFYSSSEWKAVYKSVWKRDDEKCQRCGKEYDTTEQFHIHHIASFKYKSLRLDPNNLIVLCRKCHLWIHSNKNEKKEFINE